MRQEFWRNHSRIATMVHISLFCLYLHLSEILALQLVFLNFQRYSLPSGPVKMRSLNVMAERHCRFKVEKINNLPAFMRLHLSFLRKSFVATSKLPILIRELWIVWSSTVAKCANESLKFCVSLPLVVSRLSKKEGMIFDILVS